MFQQLVESNESKSPEPVAYEYKQPDREIESNCRDLIIRHSSGKFNTDNPQGTKAAEKVKKESNDSEYHIKLSFADEITFDGFLDDEGNCN